MPLDGSGDVAMQREENIKFMYIKKNMRPCKYYKYLKDFIGTKRCKDGSGKLIAQTRPSLRTAPYVVVLNPT